MKKFISLITFLYISLSATAQTKVKDVWLSMPDSLIVYLDKSKKKEMTNLFEMKAKAETTTVFEEKAVLEDMTDSYISVKLNNATMLQMRVLRTLQDKEIICVVKTLSSPQKESEVDFYSTDWKLISSLNKKEKCPFIMRSDKNKNGAGLDDIKKTLFIKPESMRNDEFESYKQLINIELVSAELSKEEETITFKLSLPLLSEDEMKKASSVISETKLRWNVDSFN